MSLLSRLFGGGRPAQPATPAAPRPAQRDARPDEQLELKLARRQALARAAGPELAPMLEAQLDQPWQPRPGPVLDAPFVAPLLQSPPERLGALLVRLTDIEREFPGAPFFGLDVLRRPYSAPDRFSISGGHDVNRWIDAIRAEMLRRPISIDDAGMARTLAGLLEMPVYWVGKKKPSTNSLRGPRFLALILKAAADPGFTATRAALATLLAKAPTDTQTPLTVEWRDAVAAAIGIAAPLVPPVIEFGRYRSADRIAEHVANIGDIAYLDAAHADWLSSVIAAVEALPKPGDAPPDQSEEARRAARARSHDYAYADSVRAAAKLLQAEMTAVGPFVQRAPAAMKAFVTHCATLEGKSTPPAKWLAEARRQVAAMPDGLASDLLAAMLAGIRPEPPRLMTSAELLRGLIYLAVDWPPERFAPLLADYALGTCYQTVPGIGMRGEKLGNACLYTLINLPDGGGVPYLARLLARVKYPKVRAKLNAALNEAAAAAGISRGELDELSVPGHGLDEAGRVVLPVGDGTAVLRLAGNREVDIDWQIAEGKPVKAPTAAMKADRQALAEARTLAKEIAADLATQSVRLQRLYLEDRDWALADWQARYRDHPLVGGLARRLLWWLDRDGTRTAVLPEGDALTDVTGKAVPGSGGRIALWHPITADPAEVLRWRDRIEALGLVQPFAQVWREIYRVTDAERATRSYSNRWAGHILKQHQFMTLARLNGWTVTHRMWVDAPNDAPAHILIPAHNLVADYWVEGAGGDEPEVLDSQAYVYVGTDRLVFHRIADGATDSAYGPERLGEVAIADVPPLVLSEVMRHCDLFTAVASIAADPMWRDRGERAAHPNQWYREAIEYWHDKSFGPMSEAAKMRRSLLERLVPRLAIADRCSFDDQALCVQGKRHIYRIHIGSAAVQIASQSRHVCIVPAATEDKTIRLPFEGDRTLSVILSKAMMLANDDKITDPGILLQL
jgi:hypothetical protein